MTEIRWSSRAQAPVHIGSDWLSSHASQARIREAGSTEPGPAHANAHRLVACAHVVWPSMKLIGCLGVLVVLASMLSARSSHAHATRTRPARLPRNARFELHPRAWLGGLHCIYGARLYPLTRYSNIRTLHAGSLVPSYAGTNQALPFLDGSSGRLKEPGRGESRPQPISIGDEDDHVLGKLDILHIWHMHLASYASLRAKSQSCNHGYIYCSWESIDTFPHVDRRI